MLRRSLLVWTGIAIASFATSLSAQHSANDEAYLVAAKIKPDGQGLLAFFHARSLRGEQLVMMERFLRDLGGENFKVREAATVGLIKLGVPTLPALRLRLKDPDLERVRRAEACIREIERTSDVRTGIAMVAARVLARLKPPGAIDTLMTFLPFNEDEWVEEEVVAALIDLGRASRALDPIVLGYLSDPHPTRRGAGALLAGRSKESEHRQAVHKLLVDKEAKVRLRAAQGLLAGHDKEAVPTLIALVGQSPAPIANRAEETLFRMAGETAPMLSTSTSASSQRRNEQAWAEWWRDHAARVDLSRWDEEPHEVGLTLVAEMDSNQVWEYARDGSVKWKIKGLEGPMDAHVLRNGHILIAEYEGRRATERDLQGKVVWSATVEGNPIACQRLNNGNTFIATHHSLLEVTPSGDEVYKRTPAKSTFLFGAQKLPNGNILYISNPGIIEEFDPIKEQLVRSIRLGDDFGGWCSVEVLSNGHFLVALFTGNKVQELDASGKVLWQCKISGVCHASRLPNGNTLAVSMIQHKVLEMSNEGKIVSERSTEGRPWRAHYR